MQRLIFIGLAGGAGTLMRYWLSEWVAISNVAGLLLVWVGYSLAKVL